MYECIDAFTRAFCALCFEFAFLSFFVCFLFFGDVFPQGTGFCTCIHSVSRMFGSSMESELGREQKQKRKRLATLDVRWTGSGAQCASAIECMTFTNENGRSEHTHARSIWWFKIVAVGTFLSLTSPFSLFLSFYWISKNAIFTRILVHNVRVYSGHTIEFQFFRSHYIKHLRHFRLFPCANKLFHWMNALAFHFFCSFLSQFICNASLNRAVAIKGWQQFLLFSTFS